LIIYPFLFAYLSVFFASGRFCPNPPEFSTLLLDAKIRKKLEKKYERVSGKPKKAQKWTVM